MNYPIDEELIIFLKILPLEDRMEHVKQICHLNNIGTIDFKLILEGLGFSNEDFFEENN